jgi:hypothetical protein
MNNYKQERSKCIPIPKSSPTNKKVDFYANEYSLNNSFFDPSKSSPPNDFLLKLQLRIKHYDLFNNFDNFVNE